MKTKTQKLKSITLLMAIGALLLYVSCSKDDENPKTVPVITTNPVTDVTDNSALGGGNIMNNGNSSITNAGIVFSSTNNQPTLDNEFTEVSATQGSFTSLMENLQSGTTYYVRAYAINGIGTGYGEAISFMTNNGLPIASNVTINGTVEANLEVSASYIYSDAENDPESGTTFQWYVADDATGTNETAISGATNVNYTISIDYENKFIAVGITPKASSGNSPGDEVKSAYFGVGEATTVTFMYNNEEVTYSIINSPTTGRRWLDRNLGAPNAPSSVDDYSNYGDLFQWGRLADGHQLMVRNGPSDADMSPVNGTTSTSEPYETSSNDDPGHSLFIVNKDAPNDWRIEQNDNLWQGVDGTNNPCPSGWRIPTAEEWAAENLGTITDAFTKLKITFTSIRSGSTGLIFQSITNARYWTSTVSGTMATYNQTNNTNTTQTTTFRNNGYACRCIKD